MKKGLIILDSVVKGVAMCLFGEVYQATYGHYWQFVVLGTPVVLLYDYFSYRIWRRIDNGLS